MLAGSGSESNLSGKKRIIIRIHTYALKISHLFYDAFSFFTVLKPDADPYNFENHRIRILAKKRIRPDPDPDPKLPCL